MNEQPKTVEEKDFLEWCKKERINFSNGMLHAFDWYSLSSEQKVIAENFMICFDQLLAKQSDPTFIADIVRQTLEYVAENIDYVYAYASSFHAAKKQIKSLHPEIVNNIIKKK